MAKKTNQADIARAWKLSTARITQYKRQGMPVDSIDEAFGWLSVNYPERAVEIGGFVEQIESIEIGKKPVEPSQDELNGNGPAAVVARMIRSESVLWDYLKAAIERKQVSAVLTLVKHYRDCGTARLEAQKALVEYQVRTGELAPVAEANQFMAKLLGIIDTQLAALPFSCCATANPVDHEMARTAIEIGVRKMRAEIRKAIEAMND